MTCAPKPSTLPPSESPGAPPNGVVPEAYLANCRYIGQEAADGWAAWISQQGTTVARIAVRPTWVSLLDYQTRFPQGWPEHLRP